MTSLLLRLNVFLLGNNMVNNIVNNLDPKTTAMALRPPASKSIEKGTQAQVLFYDSANFLRTPIVEHLEATV